MRGRGDSMREWADRLAVVTLLLLAGTAPAAAQARDQHRGSAGDPQHLRYVTVNGVRLAYRVEGAGFPVVFVHGEGYSHELWTQQLKAFRQKYLVVTYDRRGHGQSEAPVRGYSPVAHAEDLNGLVTHLGLREAHFVVNSRGGNVILQFLRLYPQKVRSLVFADATINLAQLSDVFRGIVERRLREAVPSLAVALKWREGAKQTSFTKVAQSRPETRRILNRMVDQYSPRVYMNPQRSDATSPMDIGPWNTRDFPDMVALAKPILIVVGELTDPFFIEGAELARTLWPRTRYHKLPQTDHLLMLEAPGEFNELVLDFLAEVETASATISERDRARPDSTSARAGRMRASILPLRRRDPLNPEEQVNLPAVVGLLLHDAPEQPLDRERAPERGNLSLEVRRSQVLEGDLRLVVHVVKQREARVERRIVARREEAARQDRLRIPIPDQLVDDVVLDVGDVSECIVDASHTARRNPVENRRDLFGSFFRAQLARNLAQTGDQPVALARPVGIQVADFHSSLPSMIIEVAR